MKAMSSKQWHGGKGSKPRGGDTTQEHEVYRSNWDRIFGGIDYDSLKDNNKKEKNNKK